MTPEQFAALHQTQLAYCDALNYVSRYTFEHGKMSNKVALQDGTYNEIRTRFHLPSQMACSVCREVGATYKGLWIKVKQNAAHRKSGQTKKRYKGLDRLVAITGNQCRDYHGQSCRIKPEFHV